MFKHRIVPLLILLISLSCQKGEEEKSDSSESEDDSEQVGKLKIDLPEEPLLDLNLSQSISSKVPPAVLGTGDGVDLSNGAERKKSSEACLMREKINDEQESILQIASDLCFIESLEGIKLGGKYKIKFDFGNPDFEDGEMGAMLAAMKLSTDRSFSVFLDDSKSDELNFYICENDKLTQKIVVEGAADNDGSKGSKGRFKAIHDQSEDMSLNYAFLGAFDNGITEPGRHVSTTKAVFEILTDSTAYKSRSNKLLSFSEDGISVVKFAVEDTDTVDENTYSHKTSLMALITGDIGSTLNQRTYDNSDPLFEDDFLDDDIGMANHTRLTSNLKTETTRSFFDSKGMSLEQSDIDKLDKANALIVDETKLPKFLPADIKIEFEPTDWDCSGTVDLEFKLVKDKISSCKNNFTSNPFTEDCYSDSYENGNVEDDVEYIEDLDFDDWDEFEFEDDFLPPSPDPL